MIKLFLKRLCICFIFAFCIFSLNYNALQAAILKEIRIEGNQRIESETILSYINVEAGDEINSQTEDAILKDLFATGFFSDLAVTTSGNSILIEVDENPVINRIDFEGNAIIKDEDLERELELTPRAIYTKTKVLNDVQRILTIYQRSGHFAATVDPKIIELAENRVDLVFEVDEGVRTEVKKIRFVGNKEFSDRRLRNIIKTEESEWYKFLSSNDIYDQDRLNYDQELLRQYYLSKGYADFEVQSVVAELTPERDGFFITFTVSEGAKYNVGKVEVASQVDELNTESLNDFITISEGETYNAEEVEKTVNNITDHLADSGYAFARVIPRAQRNFDNKTLDLTLSVEKGNRVFVERIDIVGNVRTLDKVIRREIIMVEGDEFNKSFLSRSEKNIRNLNFFEKVEIVNKPGSRPDLTVIEVKVEEKSTGELMLTAGFSTLDGGLVGVSLKERNLLGTGHKIGGFASLSQKRQNFNLSYTDPYFLDKKLAAGVDAFHLRQDLEDESSFKKETTGGSLRMSYNINESLVQAWKYTLKQDDVKDVKATASNFIRSQEGSALRSIVSHTLSYDKRDNVAYPTEGYYLSLTTDVAGLGGDVAYYKNVGRAGYYIPIYGDIIGHIKGEAGHIDGISDDIELVDRFFIGGNKIRGFDTAGIGPRDRSTRDALGGNTYAAGSVEVLFPIDITEALDLKGAVFTDFGTLTNIDETSAGAIDDDASIRATAGIGIGWKSPMGPIRMDVAFPYAEEDFDKRKVFNIKFGTRF